MGHSTPAPAAGQGDFAAPDESKPAMDKRQLIEDIRKINISADEKFLSQFDAKALQQYLDHLQGAQQNRIHIAGWVRQRRKVRIAS